MNTQVRPPIDPRIRQRRISVRREEGRRRLRLLVGAVTVSGLVLGGWGATRSPLLDVDGIDVEGAAHTAREELVAASGIRFGDAMVDVDERGAARAVAALPWVLSTSVERRWPDSIVIHVVEREAVAAAPAPGDGWALIDATGQVLAVLTSPPSNLLALDGIAPAGPPGSVLGGAAAELLAVAAAVPDDLRPRVAAVHAGGDQGGVELRLHPEGTLRLGPPHQLEDKFRAALTVLGQVDTHALATLDVRIPESPVLTRLNPVDKVSPLGTG